MLRASPPSWALILPSLISSLNAQKEEKKGREKRKREEEVEVQDRCWLSHRLAVVA